MPNPGQNQCSQSQIRYKLEHGIIPRLLLFVTRLVPGKNALEIQKDHENLDKNSIMEISEYPNLVQSIVIELS